jgi:hypothetical protein
MTPEELERLVAQADLHALAKACEDLPEATRRKLSKTASGLLRKINAALRRDFDAPVNKAAHELLGRFKRWIAGQRQPFLDDQRNAAELAVLATCALSQTKRIESRTQFGDGADDLIVKILTDRRPAWADDWIADKIKGDWKRISWDKVRTLIKNGVCEKPTVDGYIELMAEDLPDWHFSIQKRSLRELSNHLLADPELLHDEVWRLFEVDTPALHPEYIRPGQSEPDYECWSMALKRLSDEGHLDRQRLLDASLAGLTTGFKNYTLSNYAKFHDYLEPTPAEKCARQQTYLALLSNQAPVVVTFALKVLKDIDKEKQLDAPAFVRAVAPVLSGRQKTQPKTALTLLKSAAKQRPDLHADIAVAASEGLLHEAPDIQERTLKLLDSLSNDIPDDTKAIITDRLADISASCRPLADALAKKLGLTTTDTEPSTAVADTGESQEELVARAEALEPHWRQLAGIDSAIKAVNSGHLPPPLDYDLLDVPILSGLEPIQPITTVEELIESVAHAVEVVDSPDEVERILDGISRLCDQKPADFERLTEPLVKRIEKPGVSESSPGLISSWGGPQNLVLLLYAWLRRDISPAALEPGSDNTGPRQVWEGRLAEIALRALDEQSVPILAAPTHRYGWLDPREFVQRVLIYEEQDVQLPQLDLIQALLRLVPDYRDDARVAAESITTPFGTAIRWALGADQGPTAQDVSLAPVWLATGRCRAPREQLDALSSLGLDPARPDGITPAAYDWRAYTTSHLSYRNKRFYQAHMDITVTPHASKALNTPETPTALLHGHQNQYAPYWVNAAWLYHWASMIWPANPDAVLSTGAHTMVVRNNEPASTTAPYHAFFHPLFMPDLPLSEMARLALWVGLVGRDADARGTAIDALIQAIHDGRAHPQPFAHTLIKLAAGGWLKINRLAESLAEVARLSPAHAAFTAEVLDQWLASLEKLPRDGYHALELLLERKTQLGLQPNEQSQKLLTTLKGTSKSAKAAKKLLALNTQPTATYQAALLMQLQARIEKAERWATAAD